MGESKRKREKERKEEAEESIGKARIFLDAEYYLLMLSLLNQALYQNSQIGQSRVGKRVTPPPLLLSSSSHCRNVASIVVNFFLKEKVLISPRILHQRFISGGEKKKKKEKCSLYASLFPIILKSYKENPSGHVKHAWKACIATPFLILSLLFSIPRRLSANRLTPNESCHQYLPPRNSLLF